MPQLTEEELKNMTPEQIAELQKQNCIFCHIVSGKVASRKVYEDDKVVAILDINPANPGHVVILPKEHYSIMPQIPEDILGHMFMVAKGISHANLKAFKAQGTNIFAANGVVAGQRAQHFMLHVIPRKENDGVKSFSIPHKDIDPKELEAIQAVLRKRVNEIFGVKEQVLDLDKAKQRKEEAAPAEKKQEEKPAEETPEESAEEEEIREREEEVEELLNTKEGSETEKEKEEEIDIDKIADMFK